MPVSQLDGLAGSLAEEIEFRTPCFAASEWSDIDDIGRMKGEDSLHAFVIYDSPHSEGFVNPPASACDYRAGEYLNPLFIAFFDSAADIYRIAYFEVWYIALEPFAFDGI